MSTNGTTARTRKSSLDDAKRRVKSASEVDPKAREAKKIRRSRIKQDAAEMSVEKAATNLAKAKTQVQQTFESISSEIVAELENLRKVKEAIEQAKEEFQELHDNDAVLSATAELIETYEHKQRELENKIQEKKLIWEREQKQHEEDVAERNRVIALQHKQGEEQYASDLGAKRRRDEMMYSETCRKRELEQQINTEALERNWAQRENEVAAKENELIELRAKSEEFDKIITEKVDAAVAEAKGKLIGQHKNELERLRLSSKSDETIADTKIQNLEEKVASKDSEIQTLNKQLSEAQQRVSELAKSAMEVASGKQALAAVNDVVDKSSFKK